MSDKLKQWLRSSIFEGILLIALGVYMLIKPASALENVCIVVGILLLVIAAIRLIAFFSNRKDSRQPQDLIFGALTLILGLVLVIKPSFFVQLLNYVIGLVLLYGSAVMLINVFMLRKEKGLLFKLSLIFGLITLALGIIILLNPSAFAKFIVQLRGISLIVEGLSMLLVLSRIKKKAPAAGKKDSKSK